MNPTLRAVCGGSFVLCKRSPDPKSASAANGPEVVAGTGALLPDISCVDVSWMMELGDGTVESVVVLCCVVMIASDFFSRGLRWS